MADGETIFTKLIRNTKKRKAALKKAGGAVGTKGKRIATRTTIPRKKR